MEVLKTIWSLVTDNALISSVVGLVAGAYAIYKAVKAKLGK